MRVEELMTSKVFTVDTHDMIDRVFFLIHYEKVRHLPVLEKGKVVGMVSDRDMYKALGPKSNSSAIESNTSGTELHVIPKKVQNIMRRGVISVSPQTPASNAAALMAENKIGALPVLEDGKLVGILSATDILRVFSKLEQAREQREHRIASGKSHT
jgi:acetoin utilization protein AcuB